MEDRELLEMAARAAGYRLEWVVDTADISRACAWLNQTCCVEWNPLKDDGDALRLAVKLRFEIQCYPGMGGVIYDDGSPDGGYVQQNPDAGQSDEMAVRRAIVRAAAIIGGNMP